MESADSLSIFLLKNEEVVAYTREHKDDSDDPITLNYKDKVDDGDAEFELKVYSTLNNRSVNRK